MTLVARVFGRLCLVVALGGCQTKKDPAPLEAPGPSPSASILPAPLASAGELAPRQRDGGVLAGTDGAARFWLPDSGPPEPQTLREDVPLPRDGLIAKDGALVTLRAEWRWPDVAPAPGPDANPEGYKSARDKTVLTSTIDLSPLGRMRLALTSGSFPLPANSELRSRLDNFGHILVWPDGGRYRILPPGSLRAMFGERRADVTPLSAPTVRALDKGHLHGHPTFKRRLTTPTGELVLEQANVPGLGGSGDLVCRLLVELIASPPDISSCEDGGVPLRAEFKWPGGVTLLFEVTSLTRRQEVALGDLYFPPAAASYSTDLPPQASGVFLTRSDLAELRRRDAPSKESGGSGAPGEGLLVVNRTDLLRYVLLDGVPVAWVLPGREQYVIGPRAGRYQISFRDFFGQSPEPAKPVSLPARVVLGAQPDAGTRVE